MAPNHTHPNVDLVTGPMTRKVIEQLYRAPWLRPTIYFALAAIIACFGFFVTNSYALMFAFFVSGTLFGSAIFLLTFPLRLEDFSKEQHRHFEQQFFEILDETFDKEAKSRGFVPLKDDQEWPANEDN